MKLQIATGANEIVFETTLGDISFDVREARLLLTAGAVRAVVQSKESPSEIYVRDGIFRLLFGTRSQADSFIKELRVAIVVAEHQFRNMLD